MEIAPGVTTHFVSNQPYPLRHTLRLAQPLTRRAAFPASPNAGAKFKTDVPKLLVKDIPFHLAIAPSKGENLKGFSNPVE